MLTVCVSDDHPSRKFYFLTVFALRAIENLDFQLGLVPVDILCPLGDKRRFNRSRSNDAARLQKKEQQQTRSEDELLPGCTQTSVLHDAYVSLSPTGG